jgi:pimeloyl-ACP methyl ester carboxylesterase
VSRRGNGNLSCRHPEFVNLRRLIACLAIPCCIALLSGCSAVGPAAEQFYPAHAASTERVPVIVIPGLLGSRLTRASDGVELWPGSTRKLLTSDYWDLALRIDPDSLEPLDDGLVPGEVFEGAVGKDFYRRLIRELRLAGGYQQVPLGRPVVQQRARLYVFTYDWRQDNVATVRKLDQLIEQIRSDYGDPQLRVDVIAHSMGGLIVRYFERYGTVDLLDGNVFQVTGLGRSKLRRVVLLGTPNQGTVTAVHKFLNGYRVGISALPPEGVATMPSTYQLFPHPLVDWVVNIEGKRLNHDVFDPEFWRRHEWSIFDLRIQRRMNRHRDTWPAQEVYERWFDKRLARARRFVWSLMVPAGEVPLVRPLLLGGDCVPTPRRLVFENVAGESIARLRPEQILAPAPGADYESLMFEAGDGSVTRSSLLSRQDLSGEVPKSEQESLEAQRELLVCARHDALTSDDDLLDALISYLVAPEPTAGTAAR